MKLKIIPTFALLLTLSISLVSAQDLRTRGDFLSELSVLETIANSIYLEEFIVDPEGREAQHLALENIASAIEELKHPTGGGLVNSVLNVFGYGFIDDGSNEVELPTVSVEVLNELTHEVKASLLRIVVAHKEADYYEFFATREMLSLGISDGVKYNNTEFLNMLIDRAPVLAEDVDAYELCVLGLGANWSERRQDKIDAIKLLIRKGLIQDRRCLKLFRRQERSTLNDLFFQYYQNEGSRFSNEGERNAYKYALRNLFSEDEADYEGGLRIFKSLKNVGLRRDLYQFASVNNLKFAQLLVENNLMTVNQIALAEIGAKNVMYFDPYYEVLKWALENGAIINYADISKATYRASSAIDNFDKILALLREYGKGDIEVLCKKAYLLLKESYIFKYATDEHKLNVLDEWFKLYPTSDMIEDLIPEISRQNSIIKLLDFCKESGIEIDHNKVILTYFDRSSTLYNEEDLKTLVNDLAGEGYFNNDILIESIKSQSDLYIFRKLLRAVDSEYIDIPQELAKDTIMRAASYEAVEIFQKYKEAGIQLEFTEEEINEIRNDSLSKFYSLYHEELLDYEVSKEELKEIVKKNTMLTMSIFLETLRDKQPEILFTEEEIREILKMEESYYEVIELYKVGFFDFEITKDIILFIIKQGRYTFNLGDFFEDLKSNNVSLKLTAAETMELIRLNSSIIQELTKQKLVELEISKDILLEMAEERMSISLEIVVEALKKAEEKMDFSDNEIKNLVQVSPEAVYKLYELGYIEVKISKKSAFEVIERLYSWDLDGYTDMLKGLNIRFDFTQEEVKELLLNGYSSSREQKARIIDATSDVLRDTSFVLDLINNSAEKVLGILRGTFDINELLDIYMEGLLEEDSKNTTESMSSEESFDDINSVLSEFYIEDADFNRKAFLKYAFLLKDEELAYVVYERAQRYIYSPDKKRILYGFTIDSLDNKKKNAARLLKLGIKKSDISAIKTAFSFGAEQTKELNTYLANTLLNGAVNILTQLDSIKESLNYQEIRDELVSISEGRINPEALFFFLTHGIEVKNVDVTSEMALNYFKENSIRDGLERLHSHGYNIIFTEGEMIELINNLGADLPNASSVFGNLKEMGNDLSNPKYAINILKLPSYSYEKADYLFNTFNALQYLIEECSSDPLYGHLTETAAMEGRLEILAYLKSKGANVAGHGILIAAIKSMEKDVVKYVLEHGADANRAFALSTIIKKSQDYYPDTAIEILELMIEHGAELDHFEVAKTAVEKLYRSGELFKFLEEKGVNFNDERLLFYAVKQNRASMVRYLLYTVGIETKNKKELLIAADEDKLGEYFIKHYLESNKYILIGIGNASGSFNSNTYSFLQNAVKNDDRILTYGINLEASKNKKFLSKFSGFLCPGMGDTFPRDGRVFGLDKIRSGLNVHEKTYQNIVKFSKENNIPYLGICSGNQHLTLGHNGKITMKGLGGTNKVTMKRATPPYLMSLFDHEHADAIKNCKMPEITIEDASMAHSYSATEEGVLEAGGLIGALTDKGVVESVSFGMDLNGFQFHPERLYNTEGSRQKNMLDGFIKQIVDHFETMQYASENGIDESEARQTKKAVYSELQSALNDCLQEEAEAFTLAKKKGIFWGQRVGDHEVSGNDGSIIYMLPGTRPDEVELTVDGADLVIEDIESGKKLLVKDNYSDNGTSWIETVQFADGTVYKLREEETTAESLQDIVENVLREELVI